MCVSGNPTQPSKPSWPWFSRGGKSLFKTHSRTNYGTLSFFKLDKLALSNFFPDRFLKHRFPNKCFYVYILPRIWPQNTCIPFLGEVPQTPLWGSLLPYPTHLCPPLSNFWIFEDPTGRYNAGLWASKEPDSATGGPSFIQQKAKR